MDGSTCVDVFGEVGLCLVAKNVKKSEIYYLVWERFAFINKTATRKGAKKCHEKQRKALFMLPQSEGWNKGSNIS